MDGTIGLGAAWMLGLSVGLTACTISCLPFMGSWVLGRAGGGAAAFADAGAFIAGRVGGYTALGLAAGLLGELILRGLAGGIGHFWIGLSAAVAAGMLLGDSRRLRPCGPLCGDRRLPPVLLGAALATVPCAPLTSLVATAASAGGGLPGAALGLAFGLGAAVTPLLALLPAVGALGGALRRSQPWLGRWLRFGAAALLAATALRELWVGWAMTGARLP